jgi:hypothetical protein
MAAANATGRHVAQTTDKTDSPFGISSLKHRLRAARLDLRRRVAARFVSDRKYLARLYEREFGHSPNLDSPTGFNEKILVKILSDRRPYLTLFADKLRVREFVSRTAPELALPDLYWWSDRADALFLDPLPDRFVLKPNHGSGWLRVVEDARRVRRAELVRLARKWLASDFTIVGREWAYREIPRAIFAEELLRTKDGSLPCDYKLFAFGGRVRLIQVDRDRFSGHTQVLYDENWNPIAGTVRARQGPPLAPPASLPTMLAAAQALSRGIDFLRVDLYDIDGKACFGELTHYPNKGLNRFQPASLDQLLGSYLQLDDYSANARLATMD